MTIEILAVDPDHLLVVKSYQRQDKQYQEAGLSIYNLKKLSGSPEMKNL